MLRVDIFCKKVFEDPPVLWASLGWDGSKIVVLVRDENNNIEKEILQRGIHGKDWKEYTVADGVNFLIALQYYYAINSRVYATAPYEDKSTGG